MGTIILNQSLKFELELKVATFGLDASS